MFQQAFKNIDADQLKTLQKRSFYGKEKKPLAYVIAIMNMILRGIEALDAEAAAVLGTIAQLLTADMGDVS